MWLRATGPTSMNTSMSTPVRAFDHRRRASLCIRLAWPPNGACVSGVGVGGREKRRAAAPVLRNSALRNNDWRSGMAKRMPIHALRDTLEAARSQAIQELASAEGTTLSVSTEALQRVAFLQIALVAVREDLAAHAQGQGRAAGRRAPARHQPQGDSNERRKDANSNGPDLTQGVELSTVPDGTMLLGHARGEPVLLVRRGDELFAIGAICTHYGAPLEQGLLVGDTVRCPWHHACFSLRTGEALRAPALDPVSCWRVEEVRDLARQFTPVEQRIGAVYVREKRNRQPSPAATVTGQRSLSWVVARPAMPLRKRFVTRTTPAASRC